MDLRPLANTAQTSPAPVEKGTSGTPPPAPIKPSADPVAVPSSSVQQPGSAPSLAQLAEAVKEINTKLQARSQNIEFSVDSDNQRTIVKVVDQSTNEILRQIPSEEVLEIAKVIDQALQGLLIKQKA